VRERERERERERVTEMERILFPFSAPGPRERESSITFSIITREQEKKNFFSVLAGTTERERVRRRELNKERERLSKRGSFLFLHQSAERTWERETEKHQEEKLLWLYYDATQTQSEGEEKPREKTRENWGRNVCVNRREVGFLYRFLDGQDHPNLIASNGWEELEMIFIKNIKGHVSVVHLLSAEEGRSSG